MVVAVAVHSFNSWSVNFKSAPGRWSNTSHGFGRGGEYTDD